MELKMRLIPKLHLLKSHNSTKSDVFDIHRCSCSHVCIVLFWVLISNETTHNLAMIQAWCWPKECGRFHNWANPSRGCSSQQWWFSGAWTMSGPTARSHHRVGCRGWWLPVDVTGGALGDEAPTPGSLKHEIETWGSSDCSRSTGKHRKKDLESQDFSFLFVIFVYCLASNTWEREFSGCPENEAAISFSETFLWLFWGRKGLQENRFSLLCSFCVLLFLLWKQSLHLRNVFWVNDAQCRFLSTSTWRPRGGSPAESGMCWKIYLPASLK